MMLSLKETVVTYDELGGVEDVNLTVAAGECVVLCGKSGCGKTTITRLLNGLIPELFEANLKGQVLVNNLNTQKTPIYQLSAIIGSVFQNPKTQFFTIDVQSELAFACENLGLPKKEIIKRLADVVELFEITHLLEREMFDLSGGEKQLVAFASAYMIEPKMLVLDEPSSNLDFYAIDKIKRILSKVKARGCTLIIAEHRLYYLTEIADRFILLENGRIRRDYSAATFLKLSTSELVKNGLRALSLTALPPAETTTIIQTNAKELRIAKLTARYPKTQTQALSVPELTLTAGNVVGIVGHNGAGKSTFAKALTGLLKKRSGTIKLNGQPLKPREQLAMSYLVMQDVNYQLFCETVRKELLLKAGKPELLEEVSAAFDLTDLLERHPMTLSGGQKQRVAIATALLSGKQLIVLDEPTSGLDHYHMAQVSHLIHYLQRQGIFVLIISHDIEFIQATCSQLLTIKDGQTMELINLTDQQKSIYAYFQDALIKN